jgi:DNA repair protein RadC
LKQRQLETDPAQTPPGPRTQCRSVESPIDRISRVGAPALSDAELLSLLLGNGCGVAAAEQLLTRAGSLKSLLNEDPLHSSTTLGLSPKSASCTTDTERRRK